MLDKNIVLLEGVLGDDAKFGRTQDGKDFFTASLCVNSFFKEMADDTERTHSQTYVRIFCYDKKQLDYLHHINVHRGNRASIFGRLSSFKTEYKGNSYIQLSVIVRDISIVQTKAFKEKKVKQQQINENENGETKTGLPVISD